MSGAAGREEQPEPPGAATTASAGPDAVGGEDWELRWGPFLRDDVPLRACRKSRRQRSRFAVRAAAAAANARWGGPVEHVKFWVGICTVATVRLVLFVVVLFFCAVWACVASRCCSARALHAGLKVFCRVVLLVLGFYWIKVDGAVPRPVPGEAEPAVLVANHISWVDIRGSLPLRSLSRALGSGATDARGRAVVLLTVCSPASFVSKASIRDLPMVGYIARRIQTVFVSRFHHQRREGPAVDQHQAGTNCTDMITDFQRRFEASDPSSCFPRLCIFPEGTTSNGKQLLYFHRGAFVQGKPVRPVLISYPYRHFSPAWETYGFVPHWLQLMCQVYNRVEVRVLPIYVPSAEEARDAERFARGVCGAMAEAAQLPVSASRFRDKLDYHKWVLTTNRMQPSCLSFFRHFYCPPAAAAPTIRRPPEASSDA